MLTYRLGDHNPPRIDGQPRSDDELETEACEARAVGRHASASAFAGVVGRGALELSLQAEAGAKRHQ